MRSLCKEEDYAFLGISASTMKETAGLAALEDRWRDEKERRVRHAGEVLPLEKENNAEDAGLCSFLCVFQVRRQLEREKQEQDRVRAIEESKKVKIHSTSLWVGSAEPKVQINDISSALAAHACLS